MVASTHPDPEIRQRSNELLRAAGHDTQNAVVITTGSPLPLLMGLVLVGIFLLFFRAHVISVEEQVKLKFAQRTEAISKAIPDLLGSFSARQEQYTTKGMLPAVIWSGKGATILSVEKTNLRRRSFFDQGEPFVLWSVLAKTPRGNLFTLDYELYRDAECEKPLDCVREGAFRPLNEEAAKRHVFGMKDPILYRNLFNEDMPPTEIKA
jgi:hypothetical protein